MRVTTTIASFGSLSACLLLVLVLPTESRKLRVKTIANITAQPAELATSTEAPATTVSPANVSLSSVTERKRRIRSTTTTEKSISSVPLPSNASDTNVSPERRRGRNNSGSSKLVNSMTNREKNQRGRSASTENPSKILKNISEIRASRENGTETKQKSETSLKIPNNISEIIASPEKITETVKRKEALSKTNVAKLASTEKITETVKRKETLSKTRGNIPENVANHRNTTELPKRSGKRYKDVRNRPPSVTTIDTKSELSIATDGKKELSKSDGSETKVVNRGSGRRYFPTAARAADSTPVPTLPRQLVRPRKNSSLVYNFETGRISGRPLDLNTSTSNEIADERPSPASFQKDVHPGITLAPKRFSSRYRGPRPGAAKVYSRGNHQPPPPAEDPTPPQPVQEVTYGQRVDDDTRGTPQHSDEQVLEPDEEGSAPEEQEAENDEVQEDHAEQKEDGGLKKERGGKGEEHHADVHAVKGSKDIKGYKGEHHVDKGDKGYHNKEGHAGEYKDEKGNKKSHKEGGGHFEAGHHGEKGEKAAEHADKEEYKKGHSTRGGHVIHKKDEYAKKTEFYDESHENGNGEKFGAYFESHEGKKGGHKKGGHKNGGSAGKHHGKKGHFSKGSHSHEDKGYDKKEGKDGMYGHMEKYGKEGSKKETKSYHFDHVQPKKRGAEGQKLQNEEQHQSLKEEESVEESQEDESEEEPERKSNQNAQYMDEDGPTARISKETHPRQVLDDDEELVKSDEQAEEPSQDLESVQKSETDTPRIAYENEEETAEISKENAHPEVLREEVDEELAQSEESTRNQETKHKPQQSNPRKTYENAQYMNEDGPTARIYKEKFYPRQVWAEEEDSDNNADAPSQDIVTKQKSESPRKTYKKAQYLNEDGPTARMYKKKFQSPQLLDDRGKYYENVEGGLESENKNQDQLRGGVFLTEEQLVEDREGDEALEVFHPLRQELEDEQGRSSRGYRVVEPAEEEEQSREESQQLISKVQVQSAHQPVTILARYMLPPLT